jgi:hypothetical protein
MRQSDPLDADIPESQVTLGDLLQPVLRHRGYVLLATLLATLIAVLVAGALYMRQGHTRNASMVVRLVFPGAAFGAYPNGQPFVPADMISGDAVEAVATKNHLASYCPVDAFRSGLVVVSSPAELTALNSMFESRAADPRLSAADRQQVADEYSSRRATLPTTYDVRYVEPSACAGIPDAVLAKALPEIVEAWAARIQQVDGVTRFDAAVLTPAVFDDDGVAATDLLVRAELLHARLVRVTANIRALEALPGAGQVGATKGRVTLAEVRGHLEDLMRTRLDPLIAEIGRNPQSHAWLRQTLETETTEATAAEKRSETYYTALREYSRGTLATVPTGARTPTGAVAPPTKPAPSVASGAATSAAVQVDRTLVDRIVDLSAASTAFRQELTREAVGASLEAVERRAAVARYQALLAGPSRDSAGHLAPPAIASALADIGAAAKKDTANFNEIYAELARVALQVGSNLYRIEVPLQISVVRTMSTARLVEAVVGVTVATPIVLALILLFLSHGREIITASQAAALRK